MANVGDVSVNVIADFRNFQRQLRRMLAQTAKRQVLSLTGISQLTSSLSHFNNLLLGLHKNILPIGGAVAGIGAAMGPLVTLFGSLIISGTELVGVLGPGLAAVLATLPGLFVATALASKVFTTAMKDAEKVLGRSLTQYKEIDKLISKNFWAQAEDQVRSFLDKAFVPIRDGFGQLATDMGNFFGDLAESFQKDLKPKVITKFFADIGNFFATLNTDAISGVTTQLLTWSASLLPNISKWINSILEDFDKWLSTGGTEEMTQWLRDLGAFLRQVLRGFQALGGIFGGIADAAAAAGIKGFPFVSLLESISKSINSVAGQRGLTQFFEGARKGAEGMGVAMKPLGKLLAALAPVISRFMERAGVALGKFGAELFTKLADPKVIANFEAMLNGFVKIIENLTPAIGPFVEKLSEMMHFASILADVVSKTLAVAIIELAPIVSALLKAFEPLVIVLGEFMQGGLKDAGPAFEKMAKGAAGLVEGITVFVEALNSPVIKFVLGLILDFFATAIAGALNLAGGILKIVGGLLKLLSGDFSGLEDIWEGFKQGLRGAFQLFITLFAPAKILKFIGLAFKPLGALLGKIFGGLGPRILPALQSVFKKAVDIGVKAVAGLIKLVGQGLQAIPGLIGIGLRQIGTKLVKFAADLPAKFAQHGAKIGKALVDGLLRGLKTLIGGALTFFDDMLNEILEFFGINSPSKVFEQIGIWIVEGLFNGIKATIGLVVEIFTTAFDGVKAVISKVFDGIKAYFEFIFNVYKTIFTTAWSAIQTIVTTVIEAIKTTIEFVWNAIKKAIEVHMAAIKLVITTVWNVIKTVVTTVLEVIKTVVSTAWNAMKSVITTVINTIKGTITTVMNAIKSTITTVWNAVKTATTTAWNNVKTGVTTAVNAVKNTVTTKFGEIMTFIKGIPGKILAIKDSFLSAGKKLGGAIVDGIVAGVRALAGAVGNIAGALKAGINNAIGLPKRLGFSILGKDINFTIPGFAKGVKNFIGGLALVGEEGPELVRLPKGSDVIPNKRTMDLLGHEKGSTNVINKEVTFAPTINNPKREEGRDSLFKSAQELAYLGLV